ncbi:MAG: transcriptional regulator [Burkholderiales bacterium]|nr:transcriptional regulator [Burkholderiales bacterium]
MMLARQLLKAGNEYRALRRQIPLGVIRSRAEYDRAVATLDTIIDEIGEDETHPLADLAEALGVFVEAYDKAHYQTPSPSPRAMLRFLMEQHDLGQSDLPEIGSQGVVSEIISGKRSLNVRQISRLAKRFNVSSSVFVEE